MALQGLDIDHLRAFDTVFDGLELASNFLHRTSLISIQDVLAEDLEDFADRRDKCVLLQRNVQGYSY